MNKQFNEWNQFCIWMKTVVQRYLMKNGYFTYKRLHDLKSKDWSLLKEEIESHLVDGLAPVLFGDLTTIFDRQKQIVELQMDFTDLRVFKLPDDHVIETNGCCMTLKFSFGWEPMLEIKMSKHLNKNCHYTN